jgi:hypothetical protein
VRSIASGWSGGLIELVLEVVREFIACAARTDASCYLKVASKSSVLFLWSLRASGFNRE